MSSSSASAHGSTPGFGMFISLESEVQRTHRETLRRASVLLALAPQLRPEHKTAIVPALYRT